MDDRTGGLQTRRSRQRKYRKQRNCLRVVFFAFLILFLTFGGLALSTWLSARREQLLFEELAALAVSEAVEPSESKTAKPEQLDAGSSEGDTAGLGLSDAKSVKNAAADNMIRFAALYERNPDFIGWLSIEETVINYPVMYRPDDPAYYLDHDFDGARSSSGVPFLGEGCGLGDNNIIIYGHNMNNGTMFSELTCYSEKSYCSAHPYLSFDTLDGNGIYEIIAVFRERVHAQDETGVFRYYAYGGSLTEERFNEYISGIKSLSLYDTGLTAAFGDKLLTLSTCDYHTDNGRFVVVAKKIDR